MAMTRIERKEATRVRVVSVAADLFAQHGYEAVTIRTVAKGAGFSTGAVFNSAKDKAELFHLATGHPAPDVRAFLDRVINTDPYEQVGDHLQEAAALLKIQLFGAGA